jgi:hypothetical protein
VLTAGAENIRFLIVLKPDWDHSIAQTILAALPDAVTVTPANFKVTNG